MNEIEIYKDKDNQTQIEVKFENETVWLSQSQLVELFESSKANVSEHIKGIYKSGELDAHSTVRKFRTVQKEGKRQITREIVHFSLDTIISLGYRVNSKRGIEFRQWATQRLKDYLIKGYSLNEKRLRQLLQNMQQLEQAVKLIQQSGNNETLQLQEAKGLLEILGNDTKSFVLLNQYDSHSVHTTKLSDNITYEITYDEAKTAITALKKQLLEKKQATELFGNEKDRSFNSSLRSIVQTFGGQYLYPSIEEQAAHLLYFVI